MHFIGIEIGHSGTRAVVWDLESSVIRTEDRVAHDWIEGLPTGHREQNPAQWIDEVDHTVRQCVTALGGQQEKIAAVGAAMHADVAFFHQCGESPGFEKIPSV